MNIFMYIKEHILS